MATEPLNVNTEVDMVPVLGLAFMDGTQARAEGVNFDILGHVIVHYPDDSINIYPSHFIKYINVVEASAEDSDESGTVDLGDADAGSVSCPSCDEPMELIVGDAGPYRALCSNRSCGYRDPL